MTESGTVLRLSLLLGVRQPGGALATPALRVSYFLIQLALECCEVGQSGAGPPHSKERLQFRSSFAL